MGGWIGVIMRGRVDWSGDDVWEGDWSGDDVWEGGLEWG